MISFTEKQCEIIYTIIFNRRASWFKTWYVAFSPFYVLEEQVVSEIILSFSLELGDRRTFSWPFFPPPQMWDSPLLFLLGKAEDIRQCQQFTVSLAWIKWTNQYPRIFLTWLTDCVFFPPTIRKLDLTLLMSKIVQRPDGSGCCPLGCPVPL